MNLLNYFTSSEHSAYHPPADEYQIQVELMTASFANLSISDEESDERKELIDDMLLEVLKRLDIPDILTSRLLCRRFCMLASQDILWHYVAERIGWTFPTPFLGAKHKLQMVREKSFILFQQFSAKYFSFWAPDGCPTISELHEMQKQVLSHDRRVLKEALLGESTPFLRAVSFLTGPACDEVVEEEQLRQIIQPLASRHTLSLAKTALAHLPKEALLLPALKQIDLRDNPHLELSDEIRKGCHDRKIELLE